ncbi:MAG: histidine phosphatase family protein [Alphaproteobacteria bacterium]
MKFSRIILIMIAMIIGHGETASAQSMNDLLNMPNTHVILRHAFAPGTGDPVDFKLGDCSTQRNLNASGQVQAIAIGELIKNRQLKIDRVYSSEWCRASDTAQLFKLGSDRVYTMQPLNSLWEKSEATKSLYKNNFIEELSQVKPDETLMLVTHYANILAFTGLAVGSGVGVVIQVSDGRIEVLDKFELHNN